MAAGGRGDGAWGGAGAVRLAVFAEHGDENHMPVVGEHKAVACEEGGCLSAGRPGVGENTFSARTYGVEAGKRSALPPPPLAHVQVADCECETPGKGGVSEVGRGPGGAKASPAASDDGAWDEELDDLLKWTDQLSPLPA